MLVNEEEYKKFLASRAESESVSGCDHTDPYKMETDRWELGLRCAKCGLFIYLIETETDKKGKKVVVKNEMKR